MIKNKDWVNIKSNGKIIKISKILNWAKSVRKSFYCIAQKVCGIPHYLRSKIVLFTFEIQFNSYSPISTLPFLAIFYIFNAYYLLKAFDGVTYFKFYTIFDVLFTTFWDRIVRLKPLFWNTDEFLIFLLDFLILLPEFKNFAFSIQFHINSRNSSELIMSLIINQFVPIFRLLFTLFHCFWSFEDLDTDFAAFISF